MACSRAMPAFLLLLLACVTAVFAAPLKIEITDAVRSNLNDVFKRSETGPVITSNFPDPCIIHVGSEWYAFATRTKGSSIHIQIATSWDFDTWTIVTNTDGSQYDALPNLPAWVNAESPNTWAPDVSELDDGTYVMYFAATTIADATGATHCVGAATAPNVWGPYLGQPASLICPLSAGGAIDASGFKDVTGHRYIVYKVDGNSLGHGGICGNTAAPIVPTPLILQRVAANGLTLIGRPTTLLQNAGVSDDGIIEAPSLTRTASGTYVLFFSSGCFVLDTYTVSYATSKSLTGPYTRNGTPLFATGDDGLDAPGSCDIWTDNKHFLFHANYGTGRSLYTALVTISGDEVTA